MKRRYFTSTMVFLAFLTVLAPCAGRSEPCSFDLDRNGDVDGRDLYLLTQESTPGAGDLAEFAAQYGRTTCSGPDTILAADFNSDTDGFVYGDDRFRGTANPAYASGNYQASGGMSGGGLQISLGGRDAARISGLSGGWQSGFTLSQNRVVQISFDYRLVFPGAYEPDECSQALVAVDGVVRAPGAMDYLEQFCGTGQDQDSGWQHVSFEMALTAGEHTIAVGAYNSQKTGALEITEAFFDNIVIQNEDRNLIYLETFDTSTARNWTVVNDSGRNSDWMVAGKRFIQDLARVDGYTNSYHTGSFAYYDRGFSWTDIQAHATLKSVADPSGVRDSIGLMFRYRDANNYYRLIISRMQGFARLEKRTSGAFSTLAFDGRGFEPEQDITCKIVAAGSRILVYVNGDPLFSATDSDHIRGSIALFTQGPAEFDDVYITPVSRTPMVVIQDPEAHTVAVTDGTSGPYSLNVSAIGVNVPDGHGVHFTLDGNPRKSLTAMMPPYAGTFLGVSAGDHSVQAVIVNRSRQPLNHRAGYDKDTNYGIAVGGNYLVAMGDSITNGVRDHILNDNTSSNRKIVGRGYTPVLTTLISNDASLPKPVMVYNEGIGGQTSVNAKGNVNAVINERHPLGEYLIVLYGTNDAASSIPTQSGITCSEADLNNQVPSCASTFKANIRKVILAAKSRGMTPMLVKVPYRPNAGQAVRSLMQEYNQAIDQLTAEHALRVAPPDLYAYFLAHQNQFDPDRLHPNGDGLIGIANLIFGRIKASGILN